MPFSIYYRILWFIFASDEAVDNNGYMAGGSVADLINPYHPLNEVSIASILRDVLWELNISTMKGRFIEILKEALVRFAGFGPEEDEWVNIHKHVGQRSLPCESSECMAVVAADLILCFQEGKEQALYFDAHVLVAQRIAS